MAKKPSKKKMEPKTDAKRNTSGGPKKVVRGKIETKTPPKAHSTGSVGTGRVTKPKAKPRAIAKTGLAGLNLKKVILKVMASMPGEPLTPNQVRVIAGIRLLELDKVAKELQSLRASGKIRVANEGLFVLGTAGEVGDVAEKVSLPASATRSTGKFAGRVAAPTSLRTTDDLEVAVLWALCEEPDRPMQAPEVQVASVKYLTSATTPALPAVIIALNLNPKVTPVGDDSYRGDCS